MDGNLCNDLKNGTVDIAIAQHPGEMGAVGVQYAVDALEGKKIPTRYGTGYTIMNKKNIDDPAVQKFLYSSK